MAFVRHDINSIIDSNAQSREKHRMSDRFGPYDPAIHSFDTVSRAADPPRPSVNYSTASRSSSNTGRLARNARFLLTPVEDRAAV
jgi:hypothetical protein